MRAGKWKFLINYDGSEPQLYDLESDVGETLNLVADHPEVAEDLKIALFEWNGTMPADAGDPSFQAPAAEKQEGNGKSTGKRKGRGKGKMKGVGK